MRASLIAAAAIALLAVGAACSASDWEYTPRSGTVTELEYEPATSYEECGTEQVYNSRTGKYDSKYDCDTVYEDECYEVDVETPEGEVFEECTTEEIFNGLAVGNVYIEGMDEQATHTPWLTPSPSVSPSASESSRSADSTGGAPVVRWGEGVDRPVSGATHHLSEEDVMATGEITEHYTPAQSGHGWWIQIQTPEGEYDGECTTEANWNLYDYGQQYTTGVNNVPCT